MARPSGSAVMVLIGLVSLVACSSKQEEEQTATVSVAGATAEAGGS